MGHTHPKGRQNGQRELQHKHVKLWYFLDAKQCKTFSVLKQTSMYFGVECKISINFRIKQKTSKKFYAGSRRACEDHTDTSLPPSQVPARCALGWVKHGKQCASWQLPKRKKTKGGVVASISRRPSSPSNHRPHVGWSELQCPVGVNAHCCRNLVWKSRMQSISLIIHIE